MADGKRKLKTTSLTDFFTKKSKTENDKDCTISSQSTLHQEISMNSASSPVSYANDIGNFIKGNLTDDKRLYLLDNIWRPDELFKFPASGQRNLKFQFSWLHRWNWLAYSKLLDGAFCKYCVLFSLNYGGVGSQPLGKLLKIPFSNWKKATDKFNEHQQCEYHKTAILLSQNRKSVMEKKIEPINIALNSSLSQQIIENRLKLAPIIETIIFCGRQGLALRGHRDFGNFQLEDPDENDGNFRALLRYRVKGGDETLKHHLENSSKNARYLSPTIQNEVINVCNKLIVQKIVAKINSVKLFSVLADETSDIAGMEQFSLCVRYYDNDIKKIREDFLQFVGVTDLTGKGLANVLMETLANLHIDCNFMIGQGYDGAAAMSGRLHGAQQYVAEKFDLAIYVHCASHSLNLALSDACELPAVRNCMGIINSAYNFFNTPKRQSLLANSIEKLTPKASASRLKRLCATRWIERHESVNVFVQLQKATVDALEIMSSWHDKTTSSTAVQLLGAIRSLEFQVSLKVISKIFAITLPVSRILQTENFDLSAALKLTEDSSSLLLNMRKDAESEFTTVFNEVKDICEEFDIDIFIPRRAGKQIQRCNVIANTPEEYYRMAVFIPFLDSVISQIGDRLLKHKSVLGSFMCLLPNHSGFSQEQENNATTLMQKYERLIDTCVIDEGIGELKLWWRHIITSGNVPQNAHQAFLMCDVKIFPTVHKLLQIFVTLPVTTAVSERSFSTLRRLKTYLRNTTCEDRLNGLALLNIHREIVVLVDEILDELAKCPRRLELQL